MHSGAQWLEHYDDPGMQAIRRFNEDVLCQIAQSRQQFLFNEEVIFVEEASAIGGKLELIAKEADLTRREGKHMPQELVERLREMLKEIDSYFISNPARNLLESFN